MQPRSRWIWLAVLGSITGVLGCLLGSWMLQAREVEQAVHCGSRCLTTHSAEVQKAERHVNKSSSIYTSDSVEYRVWVSTDTGQDSRIDDVGKLWSKGDRVTVHMLDDRIVLLEDRKVWTGWGIHPFGVLLVLMPIFMASLIGTMGQATCLALHYLKKRPSHTLQTFSAIACGLLAGELFGFALYFGMNAQWFWVPLSVAVSIGIGVIEALHCNMQRAAHV